ncbi:MAG: nitrate- and nitrite sensing domain-containing protein [Dermatophilaceae bacterium]
MILLVPLLALLVVSGLQVTSGLGSAWAAGDTDRLAQLQVRASGLISALQDERTSAAVLLSSEGAAPSFEQSFGARADATDAQAERYTRQARDSDLASAVRARVDTVSAQLEGLATVRQDVIERRLEVSAVSDQYSTVIADLLSLGRLTSVGNENEALSRSVVAAAAYAGYQEASAQTQTLLSSALSTGELGGVQGLAVIGTLNSQESSFAEFAGSATASQLTAAAATGSNQAVTQVAQQEQVALRAVRTGEISGSLPQWLEASGSRLAAIREVQRDLVESVSGSADRLREEALRSAALNAAALLSTGLLALLIGLAIARSMIRPIQRLRAAALEAAYHQVPRAVEAARAGHRPPEDQVQSLGVSGRDEVGQLAGAFSAIQAQAIRVATEQAVRRQETQALVQNLARRTQSQVDRAMSRIDAMEKEEADPDRLAEIYDLDHAITRMRRTSDNLLVLTGEQKSRGSWQDHPEPVRNVLQAAISEVEQYQRVDVVGNGVDSVLVQPHAVKDVVHLLAELLENATTFSSPRTSVIAEARRVGDRVVVEIEDSGVGLGITQLEEINEHLRRPQELDVAVARQMGVYVVARLAAIHGIHVALRLVRHGGVLAIVELPDSILQWATPAAAPNLNRPVTSRPQPVPKRTVPVSPPAVVAVSASSRTAGQSDAAAVPVSPPPVVAVSASSRPAGQSDAAAVPVSPPPVVAVNASSRTAGQSDAAAVPVSPPPVVAVNASSRPTHQPIEHLEALARATAGRPGPPRTAAAPDRPVVSSDPEALGGRDANAPGSPIFDAVRSEWFRAGRAVDTGDRRPDQREWATAADIGWARARQAGMAAISSGAPPVTAESNRLTNTTGAKRDELAADGTADTNMPAPGTIPLTRAGLPKRTPMAQLVPGSVSSSTAATRAQPSPSRTRSPRGEDPGRRSSEPARRQRGATASTLRSFTAGAHRARTTSKDPSAPVATAPATSEQDRGSAEPNRTAPQED